MMKKTMTKNVKKQSFQPMIKMLEKEELVAIRAIPSNSSRPGWNKLETKMLSKCVCVFLLFRPRFLVG